MRLNYGFAALVVSVMIIPTYSFADEEAFSPLSTHCDAQTTWDGGGRKCDTPPACHEAPSGWLIVENTIDVDTGRRYGGTNYACHSYVASEREVVGGKLSVPTKICVTGYAHSPSGLAHANERGGVECVMKGRQVTVNQWVAELLAAAE